MTDSLFFEPEKKRSRLFEEVVVKSWWIILFFLICYFTYDQAMRRRDREKEQLQKKEAWVLKQKQEALQLNLELREQIESQNDSAWIELMLMKGLGLVPEGEQKVFFWHDPLESK